MEIHPIQSFKAMPAKKKAAVVAGTAVAAGAIATTAYAYTRGKKADAKGFEAVKKGYQEIGEAIKNKFNQIFKKGENAPADKAQPTPDVPTPPEA